MGNVLDQGVNGDDAQVDQVLHLMLDIPTVIVTVPRDIYVIGTSGVLIITIQWGPVVALVGS